MAGYAVQSRKQQTRRRLKKAGFRADSLEAMTEVLAGMEERLATKEDLAKAEGVLKQDIADVRTELSQDIADVRTELSQDIADVRTELKQDIADVRNRTQAGHRRASDHRGEETRPASRPWSGQWRLSVRRVRDRFEGFRQEVGAKMEGMRSQIEALRSQIEALRSEMHAQRDGLREEMAALRSEVRTIRWVLGGMCALMVPMLAGIIGIALQLAQQ